MHAEIDGYGHVNNAVYVTWLDDCAWAHSTDRGIPPEMCRRLGRGMAVWRTQINYLLPAIGGRSHPGGDLAGAKRPAAAHRPAFPDPPGRGRRDAAAGTDPLCLHRSRERSRAADAGGVRPLHRRTRGRGGAAWSRRNDSFRVSNRSRKRLSLPLSTPAEGPRHDRIHRLRRTCRPPAEDPAHAPHSAGLDALRWIRRGRAAGLRADDHDRHQRPRRRRGQDPDGRRRDPGLPRDAAAKGGPFPVVLVVQEIFGVHEHIKDVCRRLAKLGYCAVAPELYARQGDVSKMHRLPRHHLEGRLEGARRAGDVRPRRDRRVGQAGNGGDAKLSASPGSAGAGGSCGCTRRTTTDLKAGVAWYGRLVGTANELQPKYPIDVAAKLKAPVLGLYGGKDDGIPVDGRREDAGRAQAAGQEARRRSSSIPDAPHGFNADYRPSYRRTRPRTAGSSARVVQEARRRLTNVLPNPAPRSTAANSSASGASTRSRCWVTGCGSSSRTQASISRRTP